ncbi:MAG: hypothetical protein V3U92_12690 [Cellulophaga sp.]
MKLYKNILMLCTILVLNSCTKSIPVENNFEPQIFIHGILVDGINKITVKIQQTVAVTELELNPINDASVTLYTKDPSGIESILSNSFTINNGEYTTTETVTAIIGHSYWIEVVLKDGTEFRSDQEILKPNIPVKKITMDSNFTRIIFNDPEQDINFYLLHYAFYENDNFIYDTWELTNDVLFNGNVNAYYEIADVGGDSVFASIQNLNFNTYQFYLNSFAQYENQIGNSAEDTDPGQLFLPPPAHLHGNIRNITKDTKALGFFGVFSYEFKITKF